MDLVLLGFCLISLLITGCIVFLDISRKGANKLDVPQENLPEFDESLPLKGMEIGKTRELSDAEEDWKVESISNWDEPVDIQNEDSEKPVPEVDFLENNEEEKPVYGEINPETPKPDFLRQRIELALQQQLNQLGFLSDEQQLIFVEEVLEEPRESISSLTAPELKSVLNKILELRGEPSKEVISRSA